MLMICKLTGGEIFKDSSGIRILTDLTQVYLNDVQTGGEIFKDTFLTVLLQTAATEIRRVPLLRISFFVYLDKSVLLHYRCLNKMSVLESLFNTVTKLMACNFVKKRPQHRLFPVNIIKYLRKAFFCGTPRVCQNG